MSFSVNPFVSSPFHVFRKSQNEKVCAIERFIYNPGTQCSPCFKTNKRYVRLSWRHMVHHIPLVPCKIANTAKKTKINSKAKMVAKVLTNFHDKFLPANLESFACFDFLKNGIGCTLDTSIKRKRYPKLIITNRSTGQCLKNSPQLSRVFHDAIHHRCFYQ